MTPEQEQRLARVESLLMALVASDRYTIGKTMQFNDGRNIQTGRSTGTKIATAADQKLGFHGATPRIQHVADTVGAQANTYSTAFFADATWSNNEVNMLNILFQMAIGKGLIKEQ